MTGNTLLYALIALFGVVFVMLWFRATWPRL